MSIETVKIPKSLKKSPLISVACEVRFDGVEPYTDLFATKIAYSVLNGNISDVTRLPVIQVPELARARDMMFEPVFGVKIDDVDLLIGPKVIVVKTSCYQGWDRFCRVVLDTVSKTKPYIARVIRAGFRSVDFFVDKRIDRELNLSVNVQPDCEKESFEREGLSFAVTYIDGKNRVRLIYSNDATVVDSGKSLKKGSVVDVDAFCNDPDENVDDVIVQLHALGKKVFFESMKESFVKTMEPVYE